MNIQIIGTPKCQETRKARRFFQERGIPHHFRDLREKGLAKGELENVARRIDLDELLDRDGARFHKRGMAHMVFDVAEELLEDPLLLKTPIVREGSRATVGYAPEEWKRWLD
ncbi:MAG: ArsC family transcriptional regulator [Ignavibacteriales bacterium]|jgi:arsenate reductase (glutaredoxin)|nr:ArsC family transcriptional regulator [Ignavibacteriales bacterium]